ncbi:MAG: pitrilysin family protein [Phycisphaerales bacterium]
MSEIRTTVLDNRLTVVTQRLSGVQSVGLAWAMPGGTAREPGGREGLASIHADLLLRGAAERSSREQADAFDRLGVSRNASAQAYTTTFRASMLGARLEQAMPLITDTVLRPRLDPASLEPVRDLALQSIASLRDDPQERVILNLRRAHVATPHNRSSYGTPEGVSSITPDDVEAAQRAWCVPDSSVLALAGDVEHNALLDLLGPLIAGWSGDAQHVEAIAPGVRGVTHEQQDTDQTHIGVCYDGPTASDDAVWLERVATSVLSGGMSSRLFTEVREKRSLVYSVSARYGADREYGRTTAYAGTTPERAQETLTVMLGELERIRTPAGAVTEEELGRALVGLKSRLVFSGESSGARAIALASDLRIHGRARTLDEKAAEYDAVTLDRLNAYLARTDLGTITVASVGKAPLDTPAGVSS